MMVKGISQRIDDIEKSVKFKGKNAAELSGRNKDGSIDLDAIFAAVEKERIKIANQHLNKDNDIIVM